MLAATRITGTSLTLASAADTERDAAVMRSLTRGPFAPMAELWIFVGSPSTTTSPASKRISGPGSPARAWPGAGWLR